MNFLESEKSKAIRWFRNFADLLESGEAELLPPVSREDYGNELRLSGTIIPSKKSAKLSSKTLTDSSNPQTGKEIVHQDVSNPRRGKMTPTQAQECYSIDNRSFTCPICKTFTTTSETGLKKHYNRCKG